MGGWMGGWMGGDTGEGGKLRDKGCCTLHVHVYNHRPPRPPPPTPWHGVQVKPEGVENEAAEQVAFADVLVVNKTDLVEEAEVGTVLLLCTGWDVRPRASVGVPHARPVYAPPCNHRNSARSCTRKRAASAKYRVVVLRIW